MKLDWANLLFSENILLSLLSKLPRFSVSAYISCPIVAEQKRRPYRQKTGFFEEEEHSAKYLDEVSRSVNERKLRFNAYSTANVFAYSAEDTSA